MMPGFTVAPTLIYKASRDGWTAKNFNAKTSKVSKTVTLVKTTTG